MPCRVWALPLLPLLSLAAAGCVTTHGGTGPGAVHMDNPHAMQDAAADNVQLAMAYMQEGNLERARDKLDRAMKEDPSNPNLHSVYALFYERMGDLKKADAEFHTAMRLAPGDPDQLNFYAVYLCRTRRVDEGVEKLEEVARNPLYRTPEAAYTNMGVCLRSAHRGREALAAFERAVQIRPGFAEAVFQLADTELEQGHAMEARASVEHYFAIYTPTPDLLVVAIRAARMLGDSASVATYEKTLLADFPNSDQARQLAAERHPNSG
ncbi:MAG TPA: type IV pilus biogenesis/stability protein PilW [Steroidobacteraceae bacterium]|nr:type IV pilus biogenesis/stability protein PilW [Steroidobacteraceae bacterium]